VKQYKWLRELFDLGRISKEDYVKQMSAIKESLLLELQEIEQEITYNS
jgi:hypothetical protein